MTSLSLPCPTSTGTTRGKPGCGENKKSDLDVPIGSGGSMWLGNYMGEVFLAHFIVVVINFTENMLFDSSLVEKQFFPEEVAQIDWCGAAVAIRGAIGAPHTQSTSQKQIKRLVKQD